MLERRPPECDAGRRQLERAREKEKRGDGGRRGSSGVHTRPQQNMIRFNYYLNNDTHNNKCV